jgi:hypothetical protein
MRAWIVSANFEVNIVVKGQPRRRQSRRAARPSGPSVAMWTASGAKSSISRRSRREGARASRMSGCVGQGTLRKPGGRIISTS